MDSITMHLCRLCLQTNDDVINIWEIYQDSTIASILTKHFWFQINKGDGLTEFICDVCWIQTKTFHQFYKQIELYQKCLYDSVAKDQSVDDIANAYDDRPDRVIETAVDIIKCEEDLEDTPEAETEAIDFFIRKEYNESDCDKIEVEFESKPEENGDEQDECVSDQQEYVNSKVNSNKETPASVVKNSPSKNTALEDQVRDLFQMNCELCSDVKFGSLSDARKHYRTVHQTKGYIQCCGKRISTTTDVAKHILYHKNGLPEEDAQIREWFAMKCDICTDSVEFQTLLEMQRHFRKVHNTRGYLKGTCCGKKLHSRAHMLNHIRWHTNSETLRCKQCDKTFCRVSALRIHVANHTPRESRAFKCTLCESRFSLAASLRAHVRTKHTAKTGEKFDCDRCDKSFQSNYLLSHHIRNSHGSTTYICEICGGKFRTKGMLRNHFNSSHSSKPSAKVQCDICGVWLKSLRSHRLLHEPAKQLNCPICNKTMSNENSLHGHISHVHGKKKHQCQLCNKAFRRRKAFQEHLATHTGQTLYNCPYCEKKFKSNGNYHHHKKVAHFAEWTKESKQKTVKKDTEKGEAESDVSDLKIVEK